MIWTGCWFEPGGEHCAFISSTKLILGVSRSPSVDLASDIVLDSDDHGPFKHGCSPWSLAFIGRLKAMQSTLDTE